MKKFLLLISLFFSFISISNATWKIDWVEIFNINWIITECSWNPPAVWETPWFLWYVDTEEKMNNICWANEIIIEEEESNPITDLLNDSWNNSITESSNIMDWPIGYIIYFIAWLQILVVLIVLIRGIFIMK